MSRSIHKNHRVSLKRDISRTVGVGRVFTPYASKGSEGLVVETFLGEGTGCMERGPWYAKVRMDDSNEIKTFRLTSLRRLS